MNHSRTLLAAAALAGALCLTASAAAAADITVSPGQSISAAVNRARPGDRVLVRAGTYTGGGWIGPVSGTAAAPITVLSVDGPRAAVIQGGGESLRVGDASSYLVFDGFEIRSSGSNTVHIDGGAHHVTLRNIYAHDAGTNGDVVKINQAHHITVERSEFARPGRRTIVENPYQECLDFVDVDDSVIRDNFIHDGGSMLAFVKGGSRNTVVERNVFSGQRAGASDPVFGIGGPTDPHLLQGEQYEAINVVFRNNVVMGGLVGGVAVYDADGAYIANNLFLNNDRVLVEFRAGNGPAAQSNDVRVVNNLMVDTRGRMPTAYMRSSHGLVNFSTTNNLFWNAAAAIPTAGVVNPATQPGHLVTDPRVAVPAATADRAAVVATTRPASGSPAAGSGADATTMPFGVLDDITAAARSGQRDRGPFALGTAASTSTTPTSGTPTTTSTSTTARVTAVGLAVNPTSGVVNQATTLTATATGSSNPRYRFAVQNPAGGVLLPCGGSSTSATCAFTPTTAGTWQVSVSARDADSPNNADAATPARAHPVAASTTSGTPTTTSTSTTARVTAVGLAVNPTSGVVNQATTLTATATGSSNPRYRFAVQNPAGGVLLPCGGSSTSATCAFTPTTAGTWQVSVSARDADSPNNADAATPARAHPVAASTTSGTPTTTSTSTTARVTAVGLAVNPTSGVVNQATTLTATATGSSNPRYRFAVQNPAGGVLLPCGGSSTSATCAFTPTTAGTWQVSVSARDADSPNNADAATPARAHPVAATAGTSTTSSSTASCPPEPTTLDASGQPRNAAGDVRECWPGEAYCTCDADNDCYSQTGYVACNAVRAESADLASDGAAPGDSAAPDDSAAPEGGVGCSVRGAGRGSDGLAAPLGLLAAAVGLARLRRRRAPAAARS